MSCYHSPTSIWWWYPFPYLYDSSQKNLVEKYFLSRSHPKGWRFSNIRNVLNISWIRLWLWVSRSFKVSSCCWFQNTMPGIDPRGLFFRSMKLFLKSGSDVIAVGFVPPCPNTKCQVSQRSFQGGFQITNLIYEKWHCDNHSSVFFVKRLISRAYINYRSILVHWKEHWIHPL